MEKLFLFVAKIKDLSFWQRIFSWSSIRKLSYDTYEEIKKLEGLIMLQKATIEEVKNYHTKLLSEKESLASKCLDAEKSMIRQDYQIDSLQHKIENLNQKIIQVSNKNLKYESIKDERTYEYEQKISQLNQAKKDLDAERTRLNDERYLEKMDEINKMKKQWTDHETGVALQIKMLCKTHLITYVDKVPFKGNPDNTIKICDEYIIFDAKSPANDDLTNFPKYIKTQTDSAIKYASQQSVRKDIFLVIPSNTIDTISQLTYNLGEYNVFVITKDSLEPIILSLKKIEEYEFAEQLSPEERDNICRVIGKFAHTTKRKIQIDQFFTNQFIELLVKSKNDLPEDFLLSVIEFEKAEKLNPPSERRTKQILTKDLQEKNISLNAEAKIREIEIPFSFEEIKQLE